MSFVFSQDDTLNLNLSDTLILEFDLFESNKPFECTLEFDLKKFQQEKYQRKDFPAKLYYQVDDSIIISKKVRISARGNNRLKNCSVPPFWLNIRYGINDSPTGAKNEKLKVVTHCNVSSEFDEYVLKEYLVYKMYNLITPYSFRVRLLKIRYVDTGRQNKENIRWAFLIEPSELMAKRLESVQIQSDMLGFYHTDSSQTNLMCMWFYMIGNTDWSVTGRHNIKLIKSIDFREETIIPVPYDFDFSGVVNASYAIPAEGYGLKNVQERVYIGPCRNLIDYQIAAQHLINKKEEIQILLNEFPYLSEKAKTEFLDYIESYYNTIAITGFIKYHIDSECSEQFAGE